MMMKLFFSWMQFTPNQNTKFKIQNLLVVGLKAVDKPILTTASRTRLNIVRVTNLTDIGNCIFNKFDTINQ